MRQIEAPPDLGKDSKATMAPTYRQVEITEGDCGPHEIAKGTKLRPS